ncbi:ThiF family adenylyltransferase [Vibrio rotiferianus]|uniref:ThiF family adenylyltransferase n=1 Tax=Vibrio rotiferianus TaxID=190895 RepID=UPI0028962388|nr:hypothetical protein THOG10_10511 [Vibrio rotiferianus]CAH1558382.1 hypothetical protein THOB06_10513 [Vibrio rotiferianus]
MNERKVLLSLGYSATRTTKGMMYQKTYQSADQCFDIELDTSRLSSGQLPAAKLVGFPPELAGQAVPHISGGHFCYVNGETLSWSPLDIDETLTLVDIMIQRTVDVVTSRKWEGEYDGEFINYWCGKKELFLLTKTTDNPHSLMCHDLVRNQYKEKPDREIVVSSDYSLFDEWRTARNGEYEGSRFPAVSVRVTPSMPLGSDWPPANFKELLTWLKKADHNAHNVLTSRLADKLRGTKKTKILCLVSTGDGGDFGWVLHYNNKVAGFFKTMRHNISTRIAAERLSSKRWLEKMERANVQYTDPEFITTRNLPAGVKSLSGLKIALIGAGTIGGFAAKMLVDVGAGTSNGSLTVFDSDEMKTANLGRHILSAQFVGDLKSVALARYLRTVFPYPVNIRPETDWNMSQNHLQNYDLVLDATGREPLSLLLSNSFHQLKAHRPTCRTKLIHVWIDGGGHVVRGLLDSAKRGQACYGCINEETHPVMPPNKPLDKGLVFSQQCGATYTPYPSGTSQAAAALAQTLALESRKERASVTYQQIAITDKPTNKRPQVLKKAHICRIKSHA